MKTQKQYCSSQDIPLFNILQLNVESNKQIMGNILMTNTLNTMGIKTSLVKSTKTLTLTVKGIDNVLKSLFPSPPLGGGGGGGLPLLENTRTFLY